MCSIVCHILATGDATAMNLLRPYFITKRYCFMDMLNQYPNMHVDAFAWFCGVVFPVSCPPRGKLSIDTVSAMLDYHMCQLDVLPAAYLNECSNPRQWVLDHGGSKELAGLVALCKSFTIGNICESDIIKQVILDQPRSVVLELLTPKLAAEVLHCDDPVILDKALLVLSPQYSDRSIITAAAGCGGITVIKKLANNMMDNDNIVTLIDGFCTCFFYAPTVPSLKVFAWLINKWLSMGSAHHTTIKLDEYPLLRFLSVLDNIAIYKFLELCQVHHDQIAVIIELLPSIKDLLSDKSTWYEYQPTIGPEWLLAIICGPVWSKSIADRLFAACTIDTTDCTPMRMALENENKEAVMYLISKGFTVTHLSATPNKEFMEWSYALWDKADRGLGCNPTYIAAARGGHLGIIQKELCSGVIMWPSVLFSDIYLALQDTGSQLAQLQIFNLLSIVHTNTGCVNIHPWMHVTLPTRASRWWARRPYFITGLAERLFPMVASIL